MLLFVSLKNKFITHQLHKYWNQFVAQWSRQPLCCVLTDISGGWFTQSDHLSRIILNRFSWQGLYKAGVPSSLYSTMFLFDFFPHYYIIRCLTPSSLFDERGVPRSRELTTLLTETFSHDHDILWDAFGVAPEVTVRSTLQYKLIVAILWFTANYSNLAIHK